MEKLKEWWNKLSTREKVALGVVTAGVIVYALYKRSQASQQSSTATGATEPVDQFGNPLYPTNLSGVYSDVPNLNYYQGSGTGSTTTTTTTQPVYYNTQKGDTLSSIQNKFHLWGDNTIKTKNQSVLQAAGVGNIGYFSPLPAGLKLQVG